MHSAAGAGRVVGGSYPLRDPIGRARRALGRPARTCYLRTDAQVFGGAARRRQGFYAAGGGAGEAAAPHGSLPGTGSGYRSTRRPRRPPTPHPGGQDGPGSGHSQTPHICDVTGQLPHPDWAWSTSA